MTTLGLFARDAYDVASVGTIAGEWAMWYYMARLIKNQETSYEKSSIN